MNKITFIGAGNMASSLIGGILAQGTAAENICASEPDDERRAQIANEFGIRTQADNQAACADADIIILAVKPQIMRQVCQSLAETLSAQQLVISIAAGITTSALMQWLKHPNIVRCMPNTPSLVQQGTSGLFAAEAVTATQRQATEQVLNAVGTSVWLETEQQIDAVTAVSGSGPAYFFLLVEAMIKAGVELGLSEQTAKQLAQQTALGAAHMLCESPLSAAQLREQVTSPQGTTDAAIRSFQAAGFATTVSQALAAAAQRSTELAQLFTEEEN